jgi:predicted DNA-binding protein
LSPRTGRPTNDPKKLNTRIRLSESDQEKLNFCCTILGFPKSEIIRQGINEMYIKALEKEKETPAE